MRQPDLRKLTNLNNAAIMQWFPDMALYSLNRQPSQFHKSTEKTLSH